MIVLSRTVIRDIPGVMQAYIALRPRDWWIRIVVGIAIGRPGREYSQTILIRGSDSHALISAPHFVPRTRPPIHARPVTE